MTLGIICQVNNYFPPTYSYNNDNIMLKFWELLKSISGHCCLVSRIMENRGKNSVGFSLIFTQLSREFFYLNYPMKMLKN